MVIKPIVSNELPFRVGKLLAAVLCCTSLFPVAPVALAEEGGTGHYLPGSMSSFVDGVPGEETFIARLNVLNYQGAFDKAESIPFLLLCADIRRQWCRSHIWCLQSKDGGIGTSNIL